MEHEIKAFEAKYAQETKEVLVLTKSGTTASKGGKAKLWTAHVPLLAAIDCKTGESHQYAKSLSWLMADEDAHSKERLFGIEGETIYRLEVRESLPYEHPFNGRTVDRGNQLVVCSVLERNCRHPHLEKILAEFQKPVTIHPKGCGELLLNKSLSMFDGVGVWNHCECNVSLCTDEDGVQTADLAMKAWELLLADDAEWDKKARVFAAAELTSNANDWLCDSVEDDADFEEITETQFAERLQLAAVCVNPDGSFEIYYDDDDMFWGHSVIVSGNLQDGINYAEMAG